MIQIVDPAALTVGMAACFALIAGGVWSIVKKRDRKRGILMVIAALVLLGNVLIWAWP
jgi:hypothetical protein